MSRVIRTAEDVDRDILLAWRNDPDDYRWYGTPEAVDPLAHGDWLTARLTARPATLWVVEEDGVVCGSVRVDPTGDDRTGSISVVVAPTHRGRGLAALLLAHVETVAADLGLLRLQATVHTGNASSQRLFRSAGYTPVGAEPPFDILVRTIPAP